MRNTSSAHVVCLPETAAAECETKVQNADRSASLGTGRAVGDTEFDIVHMPDVYLCDVAVPCIVLFASNTVNMSRVDAVLKNVRALQKQPAALACALARELGVRNAKEPSEIVVGVVSLTSWIAAAESHPSVCLDPKRFVLDEFAAGALESSTKATTTAAATSP